RPPRGSPGETVRNVRRFVGDAMTRHLWSGRFDAPPHASTFEWGSSFSFDRRLFEDDVTGSLAWARGLARAGVLKADEARAIEAALKAILERGRAEPSFVDGPDE